MRTMTVRDIEYLSAKNEIAAGPFDLGKQIQRFQRTIENTDWDERLVRCVTRFDRVFLFVVILLAAAFFLSLAGFF